MDQMLVAVDAHPHAEKVVDYAINFAKSTGAKIILVHVITDKGIPAGLRDEYRDSEGTVMEAQYYEDIFERTVAGLRKRIEKANIPCEGIYGVGDPAKFILATAKSKKASTIVVGIHGLRRVGRVLALGEVARNIIEGSQVPVIVIPQFGSH